MKGRNPVTLYDRQELTEGQPHHRQKDHAPSSFYLALSLVTACRITYRFNAALSDDRLCSEWNRIVKWYFPHKIMILYKAPEINRLT